MTKPLVPDRRLPCHLVCWQGRLRFEDSWITREDPQRLNPDPSEQYQSQINLYSTGSSSSHPGRIDGNIRSTKDFKFQFCSLSHVLVNFCIRSSEFSESICSLESCNKVSQLGSLSQVKSFCIPVQSS